MGCGRARKQRERGGRGGMKIGEMRRDERKEEGRREGRCASELERIMGIMGDVDDEGGLVGGGGAGMESAVDFDGDFVHFAATLLGYLLALVILFLDDDQIDQLHVRQHLEAVANDLPIGSMVVAGYRPIALVGPEHCPQGLDSGSLGPDVQVTCNSCSPGEEPVGLVRSQDLVRACLHEVRPLPLEAERT
jgi:hypothetical protein